MAEILFREGKCEECGVVLKIGNVAGLVDDDFICCVQCLEKEETSWLEFLNDLDSGNY